MQQMNEAKTKIRTQHGEKEMVATGCYERVHLSSGRALGITKLCSLMLLIFATTASWAQVVSPNAGSVPSGTATNQVLRLTLNQAINRAMRYNLGVIESDENTRAARGQRLLALSYLLPQVSAGIHENVDQVNFTALGLGAVKIPGIPAVAGPFSYSTASASLSQTLFSYESIERFRSARTAEQAVRHAKGKLLQARADLRSAETAPQQVSMTRAKAEAADAQARQRKAQLDQAELNLSYTVVRSPVTGIVGKKTVEVGQNVGIGQELVEVVPLDDVWVTANFKETQLAHMRPGQPVEIKVDAYGRTWKAHVTNLGAGAGSVFSLLPPENATGNYVKVVQRVPVRVDFDRTSDRTFDRNPGPDPNAEGLLKPGLSVEPEVRVR
jgi:multidrug efflux pump subunit AcrA (membrane-fusion protein)